MCSHTDGRGHDCAYVEARNKLIPIAEREADELVRSRLGLGGEARSAFWSRCFHDAMARLVVERGVTRPRVRAAA